MASARVLAPLAVTVAVSSLAACIAEPDYSGRACNSDAPCPSGYVCIADACQPAGLGPAVDAGPTPDGGVRDTGPRDAAVADAGGPDAGRLDTGVSDTGVSDAGAPDATPPDAGPAIPIEVATWNKHNLARFSDGRVYAWGWNSNGQVSDAVAEEITQAVQVDLTDVTMVRAGGTHSVAMRSDGTLWAWGNDQGGQLGRGALGPARNPNPAPIVDTTGAGRLANIQDVRCGYDFCLALTDGGAVLSWGANSFGSLGHGGATDVATGTPTPVPGLSNIQAIAAGTYHGVALDAGGAVWTWGYDEYGQLGLGRIGVNTNLAARVVGEDGTGRLTGIDAIDAGWGHTVGRTQDGRIYAWGWNAYLQLGPSPAGDRDRPALVLNAGGTAPLTGVLELRAGFAFTITRRIAGRLDSWGNNGFGQLGAGDVATTRAAPSAVRLSAGGTIFQGVTSYAAGGDHAVAIANEEVWAWGSNVYGELGNGRSGMGERALAPVRVPGL